MLLQAHSTKRTIDQYQSQLAKVEESRVLRIGFAGDAGISSLAASFGEVHCVDFSGEDTAVAARAAEAYPNVFTYLSRRPDLQQFASAHFLMVEAAQIPWHADREWTAECFRAGARVMKPGGLLRMQLPAAHMNEAEMVDLTRRFQLQTLLVEGPDSSGQTIGLWRRCEMGWREELATLAGITAVQICKITNAQRAIPVAPCRGVYAAINIWTQGLPPEADLFDLEVRIGGSRAKLVSIGPPDAKEVRQLLVHLPELEQTGLLPVELSWMEERMGKPGVLRVVPPPPQVPRVISVTSQASGAVAVVIDELQDPDDFAATIDGRPAWGYENRCLNGQIPRYEIRFQLPDAVESGDRELELRIGRRQLPPIAIAVAAVESAAAAF
jgi:hypothetical protein